TQFSDKFVVILIRLRQRVGRGKRSAYEAFPVVGRWIGKVQFTQFSLKKCFFDTWLFLVTSSGFSRILFKNCLPVLPDLICQLCLIPDQKNLPARFQDTLAFRFEGNWVKPMEGRGSKDKVDTSLIQGGVLCGGIH